MLVSIWMGTNMADRNQQKQSSVIAFGYKSVNLFFEEHINMKVIFILKCELFRYMYQIP